VTAGYAHHLAVRCSVEPSGDAHFIELWWTPFAVCTARLNLPDDDAVLFVSATSGIVADLEMRGEGNLAGIWA
jgi:hypothetical protein